MARSARILTRIDDAWGEPWDVRATARPADLTLYQGWPAGAPRGAGGVGGPSWIITAAALSMIRDFARDLDGLMASAGVGRAVAKRWRRLAGVQRQSAAHEWWSDRAVDLLTLTPAQFSGAHGVSKQAALNWRRRLAIPGRNMRDGWWRDPEHVARLTGTLPRSWLADYYGLSIARIDNLRSALRGEGHRAPDQRVAMHYYTTPTPLGPPVRIVGAQSVASTSRALGVGPHSIRRAMRRLNIRGVRHGSRCVLLPHDIRQIEFCMAGVQ